MSYVALSPNDSPLGGDDPMRRDVVFDGKQAAAASKAPPASSAAAKVLSLGISPPSGCRNNQHPVF